MKFEVLYKLLIAIRNLDKAKTDDYLSVFEAYKQFIREENTENSFDDHQVLFLVLQELVKKFYEMSVSNVEL